MYDISQNIAPIAKVIIINVVNINENQKLLHKNVNRLCQKYVVFDFHLFTTLIITLAMGAIFGGI